MKIFTPGKTFSCAGNIVEEICAMSYLSPM